MQIFTGTFDESLLAYALLPEVGTRGVATAMLRVN
jgi:hypothetical protein